MKEGFSIKKIPIWLLSFLFVNILYMIFKDFVFYFVSITVIVSFILMKVKNKSSFIILELIICVVYFILFAICVLNKEQIVLKIVILNLESWILLYFLLKNNYHIS